MVLVMVEEGNKALGEVGMQVEQPNSRCKFCSVARFEVTGGCGVSSQGNLDIVNPLSLGEAVSSVQKFFLLWKFPALGFDLAIDDTL